MQISNGHSCVNSTNNRVKITKIIGEYVTFKCINDDNLSDETWSMHSQQFVSTKRPHTIPFIVGIRYEISQ